MGLFSYFQKLYDLDTLDTRFTTQSSASYRTVVESRGDDFGSRDAAKARVASKAGPSRWKTPEFLFYAVFVAFCIPYMCWIPYTVSRPSAPEFHKYEPYLSPGWIPGRKIDITDSQYRSFRSNLPYLAALLTLHPLCRQAWNKFFKPLPRGKTVVDTAEARLEQRASFDYSFALIFLAGLHGFSMFKVLTILWINYNLATNLPRQYIPAATWGFNIGVLFLNELCDGYKYKDIAAVLSGTSPYLLRNAPIDGSLTAWGAWMDSWSGIMGRWEILFNITVLRLISFNLDYYWSLNYRSSVNMEKKQLDPTSLSERDRVTIPAQARDFTFRNYLAYALYAPLYLTGPILTFNDYISQLRYRSLSIEAPRTIRYAVRFLLCLLCMEVMLHFIYVNAIAKVNPDWSAYTPAQLSLLSYISCMIIWLKLLLPWRLFRLWSLIDGIDPPENMVRCMTDNYSTTSFWRSWHRSYNKWLVRYLWIPLGGSDFSTMLSAVRSIGGYLLVFTFVALWHDIKLRLLMWSWLIVLFLLPEAIAVIVFPKRKFDGGRETTYRMLCAAGGVCNCIIMMIANLVGFAFGMDGLKSILKGIFDEWSGVMFFLSACGSIFVGVQVMFEVRESEKRKGINLKC